MLNAIKKCLEAQNWMYSELACRQHQIIQLKVHGSNGAVNVVIDVCKTEVMMVAICPTYAPAAKRPAMAELLTRINYQMLIGNFDMDFDDGEIRYKVCWSFDHTSPTPDQQIEQNLLTCIEMLDYYLPAVMKVCYGNLPPVAALTALQNQIAPILN